MALLSNMRSNVSIIGFGEAAQSFVNDSRWLANASSYDVKLTQTAFRTGKLNELESANVAVCETNHEAVCVAKNIVSLVTADKAVKAAEDTAAHINPGAIYFDMNSVSPASKEKASAAITEAGAHYVDVAIMAPVQPKCLSVKLLISGEKAAKGAERLAEFGFSNIAIAGPKVGQASAIKMIRSVMVKGMEALTAECMIAAHSAGLTEEVLNALGKDWPARANYNLERMIVHGKRRAAEMEEACATLESLGVPPIMTAGTVQLQHAMGALNAQDAPKNLSEKLAWLELLEKADKT